jgi:hypothetical protein
VTVENDVNPAAVGSTRRGVGQGVDNFVFLSVGTVLGGPTTSWRAPWSTRRRARIAQHIVPIAAVADVALIGSAAGSGQTGTCCSRRCALLAERCRYPPRVEVSSLGDAAVLTGRSASGSGRRWTTSS